MQSQSVQPTHSLPSALQQTPWQGQQAAQTPASNCWQGHCHLPDGNSDWPRNLPGKPRVAVPHVPTSACLSSSALGDSSVAGVPPPGLAPNPLSQEWREEVLKGALKDWGGRGMDTSPPQKKKKNHKQCQQPCFSNLFFFFFFF